MSRALIWQALDDLQGVKRKGLTDEQRELNAARYAQLKAAAKDRGVRRTDCVAVLNCCARTADTGSLRTDQSVEQVMAKTDLGKRTVQRAFDALEVCGLVVTLTRGGGRTNRKQGKVEPRGSVRWLKFADEAIRAAADPVDNTPADAETHASDSRNSCQSERNSCQSAVTLYRSSTNHLQRGEVSADTRAGTDPTAGRGLEARAATSWADQVAWNVAVQVLAQERNQGRAEVRNPDAVIRKHKLPKATDWVTQLLRRSDRHKLELLPPDWPDLIAWGADQVISGPDAGNWAGGQAVKQAGLLWDEQQAPALTARPRPAVM